MAVFPLTLSLVFDKFGGVRKNILIIRDFI